MYTMLNQNKLYKCSIFGCPFNSSTIYEKKHLKTLYPITSASNTITKKMKLPNIAATSRLKSSEFILGFSHDLFLGV